MQNNLSEEKIKESVNRLLYSRMRILCKNGFYGLLLMQVKFALTDECKTAQTDGNKISFSYDFLNSIKDSEVDFVLMHEILHIILRHCVRGKNFDAFLFNVACDIVVNSNILHSYDMDLSSISISNYGVSMHLAPNGREGYFYTAEEIYKMLLSNSPASSGASSENQNGDSSTGDNSSNGEDEFEKVSWDNHSKWKEEDRPVADPEWQQKIREAYECMIRQGGGVPEAFKRTIEEFLRPQKDWKELLNEFISVDKGDYTFSPPDRRFSDSPFFLPDFNDDESGISNVLFFVDTSGSITGEQLKASYSEIKGAIEQFEGKLCGWIGFFDDSVYEPKLFSSVQEFLKAVPVGGGGTSFYAIFNYIKQNMSKMDIRSIVILTDGYATFPPESNAMNIPVLWLINNNQVTPPWGRVARIKT